MTITSKSRYKKKQRPVYRNRAAPRWCTCAPPDWGPRVGALRRGRPQKKARGHWHGSEELRRQRPTMAL